MESCSTSASFREEVLKLSAENELRFVVDEVSTISVVLKYGLAECFGADLFQGKKYEFPGKAKVSIFTWQGCTIVVTGKAKSFYITKESGMVINVNIHAAIEQLRQKADANGTKGPVVMVAGPTDVGKSTLCKILLNYGFRQGRTPMFVDLDVGQSDISMPATIGGLLIDEPSDPVDGFTQKRPIVYHYGHKSPGNNIRLYNYLVSRLAEVIGNRRRYDNCANTSGVIINTCGWIRNDGYRAVTHAALAFEVDVVLVISHERFYHQLSRDLPSFVKLVYLPQISGVIDRGLTDRRAARENTVREYFYGISKPLHPHSFDVSFDSVKIYRIQRQSEDDLRTLGMILKEEGLRLVPVIPGFHLLNRILSVTFCTSVEDDIITTNLAGFICITKVDNSRRQLTVLSPNEPPLPNHILLHSDVLFTQELQASRS